MKKKISIIIPCYNEEKNLPILYAALTKVMSDMTYDWEILCIDDGSTDNTTAVMCQLRESDKRVNYIHLSRNFGKEAAMLCGFDYANGDCAIIIDADMQHPPHLIPIMVEKWEQEYDDVYAKCEYRGNEGWMRRKFSLLYYKILRSISKHEVVANVGDFRLIDRKCIDALRKMRESERYTKGMFSWIGYNKTEIVFDRQERAEGKSTWNFLSLFKLAIDGITSHSTTPLRISTMLGVLAAMTSFGYMLYFLIKTMLHGDTVQGFPTLIVVILFLGGCQLLSIGILGEYIGRIFNETKNRPVYLIKEHNEQTTEEEQITEN